MNIDEDQSQGHATTELTLSLSQMGLLSRQVLKLDSLLVWIEKLPYNAK